ncbi:hypothetical protein MIDIC_310048 [Alphaproteobacteria bacterium]
MLYELRNEHWEMISGSLPGKEGEAGVERITELSCVGLNRILWRALPCEYGK